MIVEHPNYAGMPGAVSIDGRINWQVSSGRSTSFFDYYEARRDWWSTRSDELLLPGSGKEQNRFSIAARVIHPTGYRPCRLCGDLWNVGYFYLNDRLTARLGKSIASGSFHKAEPISVAIKLAHDLGGPEAIRELAQLFPERREFFEKYGVSQEAFERSNYIPSPWLSPGFMADPPDRLDGLHDYCLACRDENDPGRSKPNMRSYIHDRRAFEWWAEGDWMMADELYNSAGPGRCSVCGIELDRVSPDHVGPLACGFKQIPFFVPMCPTHQSSKNRRMSLRDVRLLLEYEQSTGHPAASWQVRGLWDTYKKRIETDADAAELSAHLRALQDCYLRSLYALLRAGRARFLSSMLSPQFAYFSHEFQDLDPSTFRFSSVQTIRTETPLRASLARRSVRIAFDELVAYAEKDLAARRVRGAYAEGCRDLISDVLEYARSVPPSPLDEQWSDVLQSGETDEVRELKIGELLQVSRPGDAEEDHKLRKYMETAFYQLGAVAQLPLEQN
jgi:Alw26I/Eco31I/Esp3I family type II restriction endonuclease